MSSPGYVIYCGILQDGLSWVAITPSLRDIWVSVTIWSALRSGGRPLDRRHDEGRVEARMSMAWVLGCRRHVRRHLDCFMLDVPSPSVLNIASPY